MQRLSHEVRIHAPIERCFDLARSVDVHVFTARTISGRAVAGVTSGLGQRGDETTWSARFFGIRFALTTRIESMDPPAAFTDVMTQGLFRSFGHAYTLKSRDDGTLLADELSFESPMGPLGRCFDALVLRRSMERVQRVRLELIRELAESDGWRQFV